jgi:hypothetical protein
MLRRYGVDVKPIDFSWNKYKAACWLNYVWNKEQIDRRIIIIGEKHENV